MGKMEKCSTLEYDFLYGWSNPRGEVTFVAWQLLRAASGFRKSGRMPLVPTCRSHCNHGITANLLSVQCYNDGGNLYMACAPRLTLEYHLVSELLLRSSIACQYVIPSVPQLADDRHCSGYHGTVLRFASISPVGLDTRCATRLAYAQLDFSQGLYPCPV